MSDFAGKVALVGAGLVATLVVPDPVDGVLWLKLLLVRTGG
jgi:hypothetical protein